MVCRSSVKQYPNPLDFLKLILEVALTFIMQHFAFMYSFADTSSSKYFFDTVALGVVLVWF